MLYYKTITLSSKREIILRIPQLTDAKVLSDYINELVDEDTFISSKKQTVKDQEEYIDYMLKKMKEQKEFHIVAIHNNRKVGAVDIFNLGTRKEHAGELQINIHKDFRGEGLGKILLDEIIRIAQEELKLKQITLTCFSVNKKALFLYKKYGFKEYGRLPKAIFYKDTYIDEVFMFLLLNELKKIQK